ncbi:MAG: 2,3,4,5-tetrahydropyridine-2,6-dicarboxylate N-succinyltransferase, partial [Terricaulis sp.]
MTNIDEIKAEIEAGWEKRAELSPTKQIGKVGEAVQSALNLLDSGQARVATRDTNGVWTTHDWLKKAVLLSFRLSPNMLFRDDNVSIPTFANHWDKVFLKTGAWGAGEFEAAGFRSVPGAVARYGSFIGKNVV